MNSTILGNLFSVLATGTDLVGASSKTARGMLWAQSASQGFLGMSSLVLGGYSAVVQNVVSLVRNFAALSNKSSKIFEYILIALGVILGIWFNNLRLIGWLPILANLEYSVAVFRFKNNERMLKIAFAVCIVMYSVFNFAIKNYVGTLSNAAVLAATLYSVYKGKKRAGNA